MFHRHGKKVKPTFTKPLKDLCTIVTPVQLLADNKRQDLLLKIKESCALEESRFDSLGQTLINNLVNHCQNLPETANSYYAAAGGLIDHALNRTEAALHLFREYIIQEGSEELSEEQKLWLYALMTAAILQGIGKLQLDYQVDLYDVNGQQLKQWNPLLESLAAVGSYYQYTFEGEHEDGLRRRLNLLLARMLMPASGFAWIASNPQVLAVWLALLNEDWQSAGTLGAILIRADAIAIQRYFSEFMIKGRGRVNRISTFVDTAPESLIDKERLTGIEFIKWLTNALEKGQIMINKAPLFMVPGGLLMSVEMYALFMREHPEYKNWQAVQKGILALGMHQVGPEGSVTSRFEQTGTQQMHSGVVLADYAVALPNEMQVHNLNTGKVTSITATELIHQSHTNSSFTQQHSGVPANPLAHLAANGQWQQVESTTFQLGHKHGG